MVQPERQERQPGAQREPPPLLPASNRALAWARDRFEGSLAQSFLARLKALDFADQAILFGAGLLVSLLPFVILLSAFVSQRIDDDISLRLSLDRRAAGIMDHLFTSAPATLNVATATSLVFLVAGMLAVASSLQQAAATIAALRLLRAKIATLPGMPTTFTIPVIDGDPIPPGLRAVIATLTGLAASALLGQAGLSGTETEAHVRDRVLYYLSDTAIELATQQALARPGHALSLSPAAPVFDVVIACPRCGMRRTLRGTEPEIAAAAEMWQKGHQRAAHAGERGSAAPKNSEDLQVPDVK